MVDHSDPNHLIDMPHSQWVLTSVNLTDGMKRTYSTVLDYGNGYYSRAEREFYGFDKVIETQAPGTPLQRTITQAFDNQNYYDKGLLQKSVTTDAKENVWARTINTYSLAQVTVPNGSGVGSSTVAGSYFPELVETDTYFYTGGTGEDSPMKSTAQHFDYDIYGNVTTFKDYGEGQAADYLQAAIDYWTDPTQDAYTIKPQHITVSGTSQVYRERSATYENGTGNLLQLAMQTQSDGSNPVVWNMSYDPLGNLSTITYPPGDQKYNTQGTNSFTVTYTYDSELMQYVTGITDAYGYTSSAGYQYEYGLPAWQRDINGNYEVSVYDNFGRLAAVYGPCDTNSPNAPGTTPTLAFTYNAPVLDPGTDNISGSPLAPASAITRNKSSACSGSASLPSQIIRTVTFADGLNRIIQTKKDAQKGESLGMTVSGTIVFDDLGRVIQQGQPNFETASLSYVSYSGPKYATLFFYDPIDRTTQVWAPDSSSPTGYAVTKTNYGFGNSPDGWGTLFLTQVVDPMGHTKESYKDVHDRIHAVIEHNTVGGVPVNITTLYSYDAIGQITTVTDAKNNVTSISYDRLGRRLTINNPDTDLTAYTYDANSNVTTKTTANLKNNGHNISYVYEYNRLKTILYPTTAAVTYEYGGPTDTADNQAGRIKHITDESGDTWRSYGKLGEVTKEVRRINASITPVANTRYETDYVFDSFGRMVRMTYPDGEILTYTYDAGGLLTHAEGVKRGNRYVYVGKLYYDEFGQRTYIEYGNGVKTTYTYDDTTRRLKHLTTVALDRTGSRNIQNIDYAYDLVGNIMSTDNTHVPYPPGGSQGGPTYQAFTYDDLYQLTTANGWHQSSSTQRTSYTNNIYYDIIGNITSKIQTHVVGNTNPRDTNYSWNYNYSTNGIRPHAVISTTDVLTGAGVKNYAYDADGNMAGWTSMTSGQNRIITWNEENRVRSIADQGSTTVFLYNDQGERALKRGQYGETVYVNRFYSVKNGSIESKHVFAGETRVCTKLELDGGGLQTGVPGSIALVNSQGIPNAVTRGNGRQIGINRRLNPGTGAANPPIEKFEFFYHGDHLGSSNFITDDSGAVYQELEYFPYGETWVDDGHTSSRIPSYQFTGKELDPETGLYYYGARYYDPQLSRWISADPMLAKYLPNGNTKNDTKLPGLGGVFNSLNLAVYTYSHNNPLKYLDPDGQAVGISLVTDKIDVQSLEQLKDALPPSAPGFVRSAVYALPDIGRALNNATQFEVPSGSFDANIALRPKINPNTSNLSASDFGASFEAKTTLSNNNGQVSLQGSFMHSGARDLSLNYSTPLGTLFGDKQSPITFGAALGFSEQTGREELKATFSFSIPLPAIKIPLRLPGIFQGPINNAINKEIQKEKNQVQ